MMDLKDRKPALPGSRSFLKKWYISVLVCVLIYMYYLASQLVLVLIPDGDREAVVIKSFEGDNWHISLTHSVEKTAWDEYFTINGVDDMTMTHTRFESLGWGYPYSAGDGRFSRTADGRFQMIMNRSYKEVPLRISEQAMQHIVHGTDKYDLVNMYGQGAVVTVRTMRRYQYWMNYYFY